MVGVREFDHSLAMIARAKQRLSYQQVAASMLGVDSILRHADLVRDMCAVMQAKVDALELRHAELVRSSGRVGQTG